MISESARHVTSLFLHFVAIPAARSLLVGCLVGLIVFIFRVQGAATRLAAWKIVLYISLAMPALSTFSPVIHLPFPLLKVHAFRELRAVNSIKVKKAVLVEAVNTVKASEPTQGVPRQQTAKATLDRFRSLSLEPSAAFTQVTTNPGGPDSRRAIPWALIGVLIYFVVTVLLGARIFVGWRLSQRLVRTVRIIDESPPLRSLYRASKAADLATPPRLAESAMVTVPATLGVLDQIILLPDDWREWEPAKLEAVLAHEVSHIARRDTLSQVVALFHRAIFWFSPLAWWLCHQLGELAEEASDDAVLRSGSGAPEYAETLLGFWAAQGASQGGRIWWQAVWMASEKGTSTTVERRVERILAWKGSSAMKPRRLLTMMAVASAMPLILFAICARPRVADANAAPTKPCPHPTAIDAVALRANAGPRMSHISLQSIPSVPGTQPDGLPRPPRAEVPSSTRPRSSHYAAAGSNNGILAPYQEFAIVTDNKCIAVNSNGGAYGPCGAVGSSVMDAIRPLRKAITGNFIWFERGGKQFLIRDTATVNRAARFYTPLNELIQLQTTLAERESVLGKQQSELGEGQSRLAEQQLGTRVHPVGISAYISRFDKVEAQLRLLAAKGGTLQQLGSMQSELGALQDEIGQLEARAGAKQLQISAEQSALAERQTSLAEHQMELAQRQSTLSQRQSAVARRAERRMKALLDDARRLGLAKPQ